MAQYSYTFKFLIVFLFSAPFVMNVHAQKKSALGKIQVNDNPTVVSSDQLIMDKLSYDGVPSGRFEKIIIVGNSSISDNINSDLEQIRTKATPINVNHINMNEKAVLDVSKGGKHKLAIWTESGANVLPTVWFRFNSGEAKTLLLGNEDKKSRELEFVLIEGNQAVTGSISNIIDLMPQTDYLLGFASSAMTIQKSNVSLTFSRVVDECFFDQELVVVKTSKGSPLEGPYQYGEILTYKYGVNFISGGNCQWMHSIIPYFSDCFTNYANDEAPELLTRPSGTNLLNFNWLPRNAIFWKPDGNINTYVGINSTNGKLCMLGSDNCLPFMQGDGLCDSKFGTPMPAGWVVTNTAGNCIGGNAPNSSWGIAQGCGTTSHYEFEFNIQIPDYIDMCDGPNVPPLVFGMSAFTDGQTGAWNDPSCGGNYIVYDTLPIDLCTPPVFSIIGDTVFCSTGTLEFDPQLNMAEASILWTVNNKNVSGVTEGTAKVFTQSLLNETEALQVIQYKVQAISEEGCLSAPKIFNITLYPETSIAAWGDIDTLICEDGTLPLYFDKNTDVIFTSSGDGVFGLESGITTYVPGPEDISNGFFTLTIATKLLEGAEDCNTAIDSKTIGIVSCQCDHPDLPALNKLYVEMNGQNWLNREGWRYGQTRVDCNVCEWPGVRCNENDRVIAIELDGNNLTGKLNHLNLPFLEELILPNNHIVDQIKFEGSNSLVTLDLTNNQVTSYMPNFNMPNLKVLKLGNNMLYGRLPEFNQAPQLEVFEFYNNLMYQKIPEYTQPLKRFIGFNNNLSGCFPEITCQVEEWDTKDNLEMPWYGDHTNFCEGVIEVGAECIKGNQVDLVIDENCECVKALSSVEILELADLTVSPNPSTGEFKLSIPLNENTYNIQVLDILGHIVDCSVMKGKVVLKDVSIGIYFMQIQNIETRGVKTIKLMVNN